MSKLKVHLIHYLIILSIIGLGISLAILFSGKSVVQFFVILISASVYFFYGILHHYLEHDLTIKIVLEYLLIALLAASLFFLVSGGI